jgi:IclR family transcriptional regulator, positive regulator for flagellar biogenesis
MGNDTVSALDRGLALMQCFDDTRRVLSPTELSRLTGIPRPSVVRLAATLVQHRWLQPEPGGDGYRMGAGVVSLAQAFLAGLDVRAVARQAMQACADRVAGSVYLSVRDGLELVIVEACRARGAMIATRLDVGSRLPLANSASGRATLAALPADERAALLESLRLARGHEWPSLAEGLHAALDEHAAHGWCTAIGSFHADVNSLSVALTGPRGEVMAFNCGGPAFAFSAERLRTQVAPALMGLVREVAALIGGRAVLPEMIEA